MKTRKMSLLVVALAASMLATTACNKTPSTTSANGNSSSGRNGNSSSGATSTASSRFVGTWAEEGRKNDQGAKFTEDGKIIDVEDGKQVGTYTTKGTDTATITIAEGGSGSATLESDSRMRMEVGTEKTYLVKK